MHVVVKKLNVRARVAINFWSSIPRRANSSATLFCKEKQYILTTSLNIINRSEFLIMADVPLHMGNPRRMSYGSYNGKMSGVESKTPFLIGVSGGTASGKVSLFSFLFDIHFYASVKIKMTSDTFLCLIYNLKKKEKSQKLKFILFFFQLLKFPFSQSSFPDFSIILSTIDFP